MSDDWTGGNANIQKITNSYNHNHCKPKCIFLALKQELLH